jgi:hypothetical protein
MVFGNLVSITIDVIRAYTGAVNPVSMALFEFSTFKSAIDGSDLSSGSDLSIDLKVAGRRTITPGGVQGAQPNDTLVNFGPCWIAYGLCAPRITTASIAGDDPSKWPIVRATVITDQGIDTLDNSLQTLGFE